MKVARFAPLGLLALLAGLAIRPAYAHAFGERYDLPLPLGFFLFGGAATVAVSFIVIGFFTRQQSGTFTYPRYNLLDVPLLGVLLRSRVAGLVPKVVSIGIFILLLVASFAGTEQPLDNFSPIFIWIIWWVGMGYVAALVGNVWMFVNPWKVIFEWMTNLLRRTDSKILDYPEKLDVWPALALFVVFAWLENVFAGSTVPFQLGVLIALYSLITWAGMVVFGKHVWLRHGEAFSVLFGFFARFSPTEALVTGNSACWDCSNQCSVSDGGCVDCYECFERADGNLRQLNLRPYAVGLANPEVITGAKAVFVVFALASVTFDGLGETGAWLSLQSSLFQAASVFGSRTLEVIDTAGLLAVPAIFMGVYYLFAWAIRNLSNDPDAVANVSKAFVFSLVPIALAYNMAHFLSLLLIQGQLIIPLLSDPFGFGWNIFGTADYRVNIGVVNAKIIWFISLGAIVLGHIVSVYIAHVIALRRVPSHRAALIGQLPMLALMVFYTFTSLWIIAQPIVEG